MPTKAPDKENDSFSNRVESDFANLRSISVAAGAKRVYEENGFRTRSTRNDTTVADTLQPCYVIEAALLTSPQPLTLEDLSRLFAGRLTQTELLEAMNELSEHWKERGLRLVETASGWGFVTSTAVGEYLLRMSDQKMPKYSRAVMETLAIIAYRQPATRGDIEDIRGVAVNPNVVRQLQERGWIEIVGHRESPGRPALFATTQQFLDDLGLKSLADLPPLSGDMPQSLRRHLNFSSRIISAGLSRRTVSAPTNMASHDALMACTSAQSSAQDNTKRCGVQSSIYPSLDTAADAITLISFQYY